MHQHKQKKTSSPHVIKVTLYELNSVREMLLDISRGRDRSTLRHILEHENHRLRKRDIKRFQSLLDKS